MIIKKYYIILIIEDLILYFNFIIIADNLKNDIRFIELINEKKDKIMIFSKIISLFNEKYTQYNIINYVNYFNNKFNWYYIGNCYRTSKKFII